MASSTSCTAEPETPVDELVDIRRDLVRRCCLPAFASGRSFLSTDVDSAHWNSLGPSSSRPVVSGLVWRRPWRHRVTMRQVPPNAYRSLLYSGQNRPKLDLGRFWPRACSDACAQQRSSSSPYTTFLDFKSSFTRSSTGSAPTPYQPLARYASLRFSVQCLSSSWRRSSKSSKSKLC